MKRKSRLKKILISSVCLILVAAIGVGIYFSSKTSGDPVNVFSFQYIGMTEYWADSQESYGPVTTDNIQTIYLSDTQTVVQTLVEVGDTVVITAGIPFGKTGSTNLIKVQVAEEENLCSF